MDEKKLGTFHYAITGETIVRELTEEELATMPTQALLTPPIPFEGEP